MPEDQEAETPVTRAFSITSVERLQADLAEVTYFADDNLATAIFLALRLEKPLLLEGEPGVGKTAVAQALARLTGGPLIRLQCYEGLDIASAAYEWSYARQLLHIRSMEALGPAEPTAGSDRLNLYRREFLQARPLLRALEAGRADGPAPVLLVDELDRADEEFEAYLLELLADFQLTIPELGTIKAEAPPLVVLTSNRTREVHDALRRRCLYHWVEFPDAAKELRILRAHAPGVDDKLTRQVVDFVQRLRREDLYKSPGVAETVDWALALDALRQQELTPDNINATLGALLKFQDDLMQVRELGPERWLTPE